MRLALLVLLAGCPGPSEPPAPCAGPRCPEICANGLDDDGDWIVDCADLDCAATCDGDGDGHPGPQVGGPDCDDRDPTIYPGASEIYHDGADNDCDPSTVDDDEDGDGATPPADCNDQNANTGPGAPEVCGDGEVNDCLASETPRREACYGERSLGTADFKLSGVELGGTAGASVAGVGDLEGDGTDDVVIGAYQLGDLEQGGAYVLHGPWVDRERDLAPGNCALTGWGDGDWAGSWVAAVGDLDADGRPDAGVGARYQDIPEDNAGRIYLLVEPCTSGPVANQAIVITGEPHDELGTVFTGGADLTGDGVDDLVAGAPFRNFTGIADQGTVLLFAGPIDVATSTPEAWAAIYGVSRDGNAGTSVALPGDIDGDGRADLVLGAPLVTVAGQEFSGEAYLFTDLTPGLAYVDDARWQLSQGEAGGHFGKAMAKVGDVSADGTSDLAIAAPDAGAGSVYLIDDPATESVVATLTGAQSGDAFGGALAGLRDLDGDAVADVVVGAPSADAVGIDSGAVYVFFGPLSGSIEAAAADITLLGEASFDYAGASVASAGALDLDGHEDVLVGAPFHDSHGAASGIAYALTFGW